LDGAVHDLVYAAGAVKQAETGMQMQMYERPTHTVNARRPTSKGKAFFFFPPSCYLCTWYEAMNRRADTGRIEEGIRESARTVESLLGVADAIAAAADTVIGALGSGNKVLTAGNGGSAAEALHMSEELVGRFRADRPSLPAVCLAGDPTALTCIANDFGYDCVFSRQVEGLGKSGDVLVLFSTSGSARNLELALDAADAAGLQTVCLLGRDGGKLAGRGTCEVIVAGTATERIQEAHQAILHLVLDAVEEVFQE